MNRPWIMGTESTGTLDWYLDAIHEDDLLTAAEERTLSEAIAQGDREAKAKMIRCNLRLVVRIARDYLGRGLSLDDLVGEGNLGLIRAAQDFDASFGTRFSTYASHWIKQSIRQALINTTATIRLPAHMVGLLTKWRRTEKILRRDLGQDPAPHQVADALGLTEVQRGMVERALRSKKIHFETDRSSESDPTWASDSIADMTTSAETMLEADEARTDVRRRLTRLDDRERAIVSLRFGLDGQPPMTLKEVGRRLGVTREWVRKIEQKAVRKLEDRPGLKADRYEPRVAQRA